MAHRFEFTDPPAGETTTVHIELFESVFVYPKANRKPLVWGFFVALALCATLFFSLFQNVQPITSHAENFIGALQDGELKQAYSYTSPQLQERVSLALFQQKLNTFDLSKSIGHADFPRIQSDGNTAHLQGTLYTSDQDPRPMSLELVKQGKIWTINEILIGVDPFSTTNQEILEFS